MSDHGGSQMGFASAGELGAVTLAGIERQYRADLGMATGFKSAYHVGRIANDGMSEFTLRSGPT
jgi:hypothetical protein